jgi:hypothetical protein
MKRILVLLLLTAGLLHAGAESLNLGSHGKVTFYFPDNWKVETSDFGDRHILTITPKDDTNASSTITVTFPEQDRLDTKSRLKSKVESDGAGMASSSVEGRATAKELNVSTGYGFYCSFTDPELVGKPPEKDNFKVISSGFIHVAADVLVEFGISADGFKTEAYQQLLGAVEGMDFESRKGK